MPRIVSHLFFIKLPALLKNIRAYSLLIFFCLSGSLIALSQSNEAAVIDKLETRLNETADLSSSDPYLADSLAYEILDSAEIYNSVDLQIKSLVQISKIKIIKGRFIRALRFAERALNLANEKGSKSEYASTMINIALCYRELGNLTKAIEYEKAAIDVYQGLEDEDGILKALSSLIDSYTATGEMDKALPHLFRALETAKAINNKLFEAKIHGSLGMAYGYMQELDKAKDYLSKSEAIYIDLDNKRGLARVYNDMGTVGFFSADTAYAASNYKKALAINLELNDFIKLMLNYDNLTALYGQMGDMKMAKHYLSESQKMIPDSSQTIPAKVHRMVNYAGILTIEGNLDSAISILNEIIPLANQSELKLILKDAYYNLANIYEMKVDYQKAYGAHRNYIAYNDTLESEKAKNDLFLAEARYTIQQNELELQNKQQALKLANQKKDISDLEVKQRNAWIAIISIISLLVIIVIVFVLWKQRLSKSKQEIEFRQKKTDLEQRALRASMNPHFIFNALNSIQGLYLEGDLSKADDYLADFGSLLRRTLENSQKDKITIREEIETLKLYLELEKARSESLFDYSIDISASLLDSGYTVPPFVLQPFAENAIWHGILPGDKNGKLGIQINEGSTHIICEITDNGVGITDSDNSKHTSKGIQTTKARLGQAGSVDIYNVPSGGTKVLLNIPKT